MHKDGNMDKEIWGQMMQLDPIVAQSPEKKEEQGNPNPRSKYEVKATISPVFSYG